MGMFTGVVYSEKLHMLTTLAVVLPQDAKPWRLGKTTPKLRTLILLHGLSDNWAAWPYRSRIMTYAEEHYVAVLMPEVGRGFYQDMVYGEQYFSFVSEELPELAHSMFGVPVDPESLMVAGLSMGGYGAMRCALTHPERYLAAGAFSSACWIEPLLTAPAGEDPFGLRPMILGMFGDPPRVPDEAKLEVLAERAKGHPMPLMMTCGTEDPLYPGNVTMFEAYKKAGLNVTFDAWPGVHEWGFWDKSIEMFLDRFAKV